VAAGDASPLLGRPIPRVVDLLAKLAHDVIAAAVGAEPRYYPSGSMPVAADIAAWSAWVQTLRRVARHEEHPWNAALLIEALVTQAASLWAQPAVAKAQAAPLR
jgi:DNA polymerase-3 subunit delta'